MLLVVGVLATSLACAVAGGACGAAARRQSASRTAAAKPVTDAAPRPKITEIKEAELKSLLGAGDAHARPLLVNFWATWCVPCREEFPDLVKIRSQYAADRLDFALVSLDDPSDIDKAIPQFLSEVHAAAMPTYLLHADDEDAAINSIDNTWRGELPATFLYDRAGRLVFKHTGRIKPDELRAAIDQALVAKPETSTPQ
jgi:thiol-disulfide isomerase/thioredoxin